MSTLDKNENLAIPTTLTLFHGLPILPMSFALPTAASEFPLFPKFPEEIRLMIWEAALPGPRLVELEFHFEDREFPFGSQLRSCTSSTPPPVMLAVCAEARAQALKRYSLSFATKSNQATIYFDSKVDTLVLTCLNVHDILCSLSAVNALDIPSFQQLRYMAIEFCCEIRDYHPQHYLFLIEDLRGLETFILLLHGEHICLGNGEESVLQEVDQKNEPEGYREKFNEVMNNRAPWAPAKWRKAPELKFMSIQRPTDKLA